MKIVKVNEFSLMLETGTICFLNFRQNKKNCIRQSEELKSLSYVICDEKFRFPLCLIKIFFGVKFSKFEYENLIDRHLNIFEILCCNSIY